MHNFYESDHHSITNQMNLYSALPCQLSLLAFVLLCTLWFDSRPHSTHQHNLCRRWWWWWGWCYYCVCYRDHRVRVGGSVITLSHKITETTTVSQHHNTISAGCGGLFQLFHSGRPLTYTMGAHNPRPGVVWAGWQIHAESWTEDDGCSVATHTRI